MTLAAVLLAGVVAIGAALLIRQARTRTEDAETLLTRDDAIVVRVPLAYGVELPGLKLGGVYSVGDRLFVLNHVRCTPEFRTSDLTFMRVTCEPWEKEPPIEGPLPAVLAPLVKAVIGALLLLVVGCAAPETPDVAAIHRASRDAQRTLQATREPQRAEVPAPTHPLCLVRFSVAFHAGEETVGQTVPHGEFSLAVDPALYDALDVGDLLLGETIWLRVVSKTTKARR